MPIPLRLAFLCVLQLVSSASTLAQNIATNCDKYAADALDPQHITAGVNFENMNVALAYPACEDAVLQYPNNMRLAYQLVRTYAKANRFRTAAEQYHRAADQNYAAAQLALGMLYADGEGVAKDDQQAVAWFRKAANQGYAPAQDRLGFIYQSGEGVSKDVQQAVAWFRKAADQGYAFAQYRLGAMYANGEGVAKDDQQAVVWFRKAAEQGNKEAKTKLDELESLQNANGMR